MKRDFHWRLDCMRIEQARISPSHYHFVDEFLDRWNLRPYDNPEEPAVFWGLYPDWDDETQSEKDTSTDIDVFNNHRGLKVLLCGGREYKSEVFDKIDNYNLICVDKWESDISSKMGLKHIWLKIPYFDFNKYKLTPLGDKIYSHIPLREIERQYIAHDGRLVTKFEEIFQYEKLIDWFGEDMFCFPKEWVSREELIKYYTKSFVNIKPHKIRGANTAWMLGCMGRNTITTNTEQVPSYLHYDSVDELKRLVDEESKKIGTIQENKLWNYFHQSDDWLHEEYWK